MAVATIQSQHKTKPSLNQSVLFSSLYRKDSFVLVNLVNQSVLFWWMKVNVKFVNIVRRRSTYWCGDHIGGKSTLRVKKINHDQFVVILCVCEVYAPWLVMAVSVPWSNHDGVCTRHACHDCQLWGLPWSNHGSKVSFHEVIMAVKSVSMK